MNNSRTQITKLVHTTAIVYTDVVVWLLSVAEKKIYYRLIFHAKLKSIRSQSVQFIYFRCYEIL